MVKVVDPWFPSFVTIVDGAMIDINENEELSDHFEIESVPTFVTLKNNNMIKKASGASLNVVINLLRESFKTD